MWLSPKPNNGGDVTRPGGWIVCSIIAATVALWWGPLRFIIYAGPNDVPTGQSIALSVWLGWFWIATFVGSLFIREMAGALATHSGAVCTLLACNVDFRWSRLRLAWALQLIDRRGRDRRARRHDPLDESENANAPAVRREAEKD